MKEKLGLGMIKAADCVVNVILYLLGIVLFLYGGYTLWDTHAVYADASPEQYAAFHPENGDSYTELMRQNPEVIGWLTIDNTNIDYPLTQADNNSKYVNTDAKGNSSLSGSLFLDCRNQKDFSDFNNIIYGHHMERKKMFGELTEFADEEYFQSHPGGTLYSGEKKYKLEFFAFFKTDAYDNQIYSPGDAAEEDRERLLAEIQSRAIQKRAAGVTAEARIVMLSTCAAGETNEREVLVGVIV